MELAEVQRLMDELYGEADRARGVPSTVAWLASLANQMDIDLDDAMQRYVENPP